MLFISFVWFSEQTALFLRKSNNLIYVKETRCVFLDVETDINYARSVLQTNEVLSQDSA